MALRIVFMKLLIYRVKMEVKILQQNMWRKLAAFSASAHLKLSIFFLQPKIQTYFVVLLTFIFCFSYECSHIINYLLSKLGSTETKRSNLIVLKGNSNKGKEYKFLFLYQTYCLWKELLFLLMLCTSQVGRLFLQVIQISIAEMFSQKFLLQACNLYLQLYFVGFNIFQVGLHMCPLELQNKYTCSDWTCHFLSIVCAHKL